MKPSPHLPEIGKRPKDLIAKDHGFDIAAYISSGADVIATALRKHVEEEIQDLSGEAFLRFMDQLYEQISSLLQSHDSAENLLALRAMDALIDMPFGKGTSKVSKLTNFLRNAFEVKHSPQILVPASAVLGHLSKVGGAMTADEVERQIQTAFGWLGGDRVEHHRFAAVLILKEMGENASTVLNVHIDEFNDAMSVALRDPKQVIRDRAVEAVRALVLSPNFKLLPSRMPPAMQATAALRAVKIAKTEGIDLISLLPDEILGTIIFLLRTDDAVRTTTLSRRWHHLWRSAPLNLNCGHIRGYCPERIEVVSKILSKHQGPIRRLHLNSLCFANLDHWFRSLALDNLQEIDIWVAKFDDPLPLFVLRFMPTLRVAKFDHCSFLEDLWEGPNPPVFSFPNLKLFALDSFTVWEGILQGALASVMITT